jgi:group I intron endonuclease
MFILENSGVYKIVNKLNGKYYPGSSKHLLKQPGDKGRKREHFYLLEKSRHYCSHLQYAYNQYGPENFEFVIIQNNIPEDRLLIEEQKLLDIAKTEPKMCYTNNFIAGRIEMTPEIKDKISKALKGKYCGNDSPSYGKKRSLETRKKISLAQQGKEISDIAKKHMSESAKGKILSQVTRQKLSALMHKRYLIPGELEKARASAKIGQEKRKKSVQQLDIKTGEVIKTWDCISDVMKAFFPDSTYRRSCSEIAGVCLYPKEHYSAMGFRWRYTDEKIRQPENYTKSHSSSPVICKNLKDNTIQEFNSIKDCAKFLGVSSGCVHHFVKNKKRHFISRKTNAIQKLGYSVEYKEVSH